MRNLIVKSLLALMMVHGHSAFAANTIVELGKPKSTTIKSIGTTPVKKLVPLKLGEIRSDEPELPISSTVESRMKKRLRMAHRRQAQVGGAKRSAGAGEIRRSAKPKEQPFERSTDQPQVTEEHPDGVFDRPNPFEN